MNKVANLLLDWSQKNVKKSVYFNPDKIQDILILTDRPLSNKALELFPKSTVLFYSEKNDLPRGATPIYKNDFSYLGKIKSNQIKEILNKNYDLFIENHSEDNAFLNYLYRLINASCKISHRPYKWVDIELQNSLQNSDEYFENINKVLQKF